MYYLFVYDSDWSFWLLLWLKRMADERAVKAGELEQKVALLEVWLFTCNFIKGHITYSYRRKYCILKYIYTYICYIILTLSVQGWMCIFKSRTARHGRSSPSWAKEVAWRCKSVDSGSNQKPYQGISQLEVAYTRGISQFEVSCFFYSLIPFTLSCKKN